ncbi:MAG: RsmD family RNA methyltransferase [Candidatus Zixiibacteriota bacterium]
MSKERQLEFRIIAGELKGKKIVTPDLGITRPPLSRLRKAIFDYLTPYLDNADYLDLFSGTGSYVFEAVSRGAKSGTGVELEPRLAEAINSQATKLGVGDRLRCLTGDVFTVIPALQQQGSRFDIIMMAPPQYKGIIDLTLKLLAEHRLIMGVGQKPSGFDISKGPDVETAGVSTYRGEDRTSQIICQHDTSETDKIDWGAWRIVQQRKYGNTTFTILGM